ncbi:MAG TPA: hypothetical protein PLL78_03945 [Fimbriimonadaceae bacterium]|nr:hypothetical protein [Fimbriimonadaceae bacterium]HRJ95813.1 hypothetical protein [Fimbriimonadaceae bacterium]
MTCIIGTAFASAVAPMLCIATSCPDPDPLPTIARAQDSSTQPAPDPTPRNKSTFDPEISLVTDFRWNAIDSDRAGRKRVFLREAELGLAADVDPFLRAEATIAFADEDGETHAEVEEAFGRYNNLGRGLSARFGKFAAAIGRVQRNHADQLNWLDYPLMVQDVLGDEGLRAGGVSFSYLFPGDRFNEITLEAFDSHDLGIFAGANAGAPTFVGAYRTFFDFGADASAQVGFSYANGPSSSEEERKRSQLFAAEVTYKLRPGGQGSSLDFEGEAFWARPGGIHETSFGAFAAVTIELRPRLHAYVKYDYSEVPGTDDIRRAWSLGATLKVTEFHHWRAEFQRIESNFAPARNLLNLQFQWAIGAHPAHRY